MEEIKSKKIKVKSLYKVIIYFALILIVFLLLQGCLINRVLATDETDDFCYLSDMDWAAGSKSGWNALLKDTTSAGTKISVKVEGAYYTFDKGIWAHATSTVIYDLTTTPNGTKYDYFTAYIGLNQTAASSSNGVKFSIYTSQDGTNWDLKTDANPAVFKAGTNAEFVKIDIKDAKYLKLYADSNGSNGNDHAVYADAKLIKEGYKEPGEDLVPSIEALDTKIKTEFANADISTNKEYELALLQRELIKNAGNYALRRFMSEDPANQDILDWLMNDVENLRPYILGGKPEGGSYLNSFKILKRLYDERGDDLNDTTKITTTRGEKTLGEMYKTMMLAISLTHSGNVYLWVNTADKSDPVKRYDIYKRLYHGKVEADDRTTKGIGDNLIEKEKFASLHVEEMRWVMNTVVDDEEIEWLNWYAREVKNGATGPYSYQRYTFGYNYNKDIYYSEANKEQWTTKYNLSTDKWNVSYGPGSKKIWIVFEEGSVCGGLSKNGACVWGSFKGLPNTCVSQPGHCAYIFYNQDANGNGIWGLGNDVGGWHQTGRTEHLNVRMPLEWGNEEYISFGADWLGMGTYVLLSQGALNQFENYKESRELLILADVYKDDSTKLCKIYEESLEALPINIDAWYGLIKAYRADNTKTDEDYYKLAEGIFRDLKLYPLPMYHLAREVQKDLKTAQYKFKFSLDQTSTLNYAKDHSNESIQASAVKQEATHLLGQVNSRLATFSFDGENAGAIVLDSRFDGSDVAWDYSLDGKQTWTQSKSYDAGVHAEKLTKEQLASITSENDIYVHIIGVPWTDENCYKIDITEQALPANLYANDLENRVISVNTNTEWRYTEKDAWTSYSIASPDLTGNKTVQVRQAATGTQLASEVSPVYTFTEDNQLDTRKYIRIANLSIEEYSTQSKDSKRPYYAPNAIDGNIHTLWHTDFAINVLQGTIKPFITIKLDKPRYVSALEFVQKKYKVNDPDNIKNLVVYVSEDGEEWIEAGRIENCSNPYKENELREITFDESVYGQYVKLEMDTYNMFSSLAMVNLFEDITKIEDIEPEVEIRYSTQEKTNEYVIARLVSLNSEITITNNDGNDTYVFTKNGDFTFEFKDENENEYTALAIVNWIDKDAPTADVKYELDNDKKLVILLDNISEDVYLLDENNNKINYIEVQDGKVSTISYLDSSGSVYKEVEVDENGNIAKIAYKNTTGNVTSVYEYVTILEDGVIAREEYFDSEDNSVTVTDSEKETLRSLQQAISNPLEYTLDKSGDHEFKFLDKASNIAYKSIKADYIDNGSTIIVSDITYDITRLTNKNVVATINSYVIDDNGENVEAEITNNNASNKYTFTDNREFTFEYKDASDTNDWEVKEHTAKVNWIDKKAPTAEIKYSTTESTEEAVVASLVNESETIIITNNGNSREYTFTENGEFTFEFEDIAGNTGKAIAKVDWIEKEQEDPEKPDDPSKPDDTEKPDNPEKPDDPSKPDNTDIADKITSKKYKIEDGFISRIAPSTTVSTFKQNVEASKDIIITDKDGKALKEDGIIETGAKITVGKLEYIAIVIGDVDGNGKITIKDLSNMKLHLIDKKLLTGIHLKAADIDGDGKVSLIDLSQLKLALIGKLEIN